jgi:hypothetical protein
MIDIANIFRDIAAYLKVGSEKSEVSNQPEADVRGPGLWLR